MFFAGGGHWMVLQTIAWGKMLVDYSKNASLATAISDTFDGEHPCPMCKKIATGKQQEKRENQNAPDSGKSVKAPDLLCSACPGRAPPPRSAFFAFTPFTPRCASQIDEPPPTPPPLAVPELV